MFDLQEQLKSSKEVGFMLVMPLEPPVKYEITCGISLKGDMKSINTKVHIYIGLYRINGVKKFVAVVKL